MSLQMYSSQQITLDLIKHNQTEKNKQLENELLTCLTSCHFYICAADIDSCICTLTPNHKLKNILIWSNIFDWLELYEAWQMPCVHKY